jgi:hypothetical protein
MHQKFVDENHLPKSNRLAFRPTIAV